LVPAALPYHFDRFLAHTLSATLGLALFNLLPFPRLDGAAILACLLDGDDGPARLAPFRRWRRTIEGATVGMMAWAMLGAFTGAAVA
jgi:Zn-dependent protease